MLKPSPVPLPERFALDVWLSSWMRSGTKNKIELDKLVPHIWGEQPEQDKLRKRRLSLRKAIQEINELQSWKASEIDGNVLFERT